MENLQIDLIILHYHDDEHLIRARIFVWDLTQRYFNDYHISVSFAPHTNEITAEVRNGRPHERDILGIPLEELEEYKTFLEICEKNSPLVAIYALYTLYGADISPEVAQTLIDNNFPLDYEFDDD